MPLKYLTGLALKESTTEWGEMPLWAGAVVKRTIEIHCFLGQKWYSDEDLCHSVALQFKAFSKF